ncbi:MAG: hypothetical protein ACXU93_08970, partial [Thermodesulfobacteriota bacterium]
MSFRTLKIKESRAWLCLALFLLSMLLVTSCSLLGARPSYQVHQYTLEYPSPVLKESTSINELIRVERFSVAQT